MISYQSKLESNCFFKCLHSFYFSKLITCSPSISYYSSKRCYFLCLFFCFAGRSFFTYCLPVCLDVSENAVIRSNSAMTAGSIFSPGCGTGRLYSVMASTDRARASKISSPRICDLPRVSVYLLLSISLSVRVD